MDSATVWIIIIVVLIITSILYTWMTGLPALDIHLNLEIGAPVSKLPSIPLPDLQAQASPSNESEFDAWFAKYPPPASSTILDNYKNSKFQQRYVDSFMYLAPGVTDRIYKVYPLCCLTCKRAAWNAVQRYRAIEAQRALVEQRPGARIHVARLHDIAVVDYPPLHQGQATDDIKYVVLEIDRVVRPHVDLRDLTTDDLMGLMTTLYYTARLGWKIKDVSIANLGRNQAGEYILQHLDDCTATSSRDFRGGLNLYHNRYNILKHLPTESFTDTPGYERYRKMLPLLADSDQHQRDLSKFLQILTGRPDLTLV
jgi:hypothetical protein